MEILLVEKSYYVPNALGISSILIFLFMCGYAVWWIMNDGVESKKLTTLLFTLIGLTIVSISLCFIHFPNCYHNYYVAKIDEDYPFLEVYNNYEVISKEKYSNIFTLKEKVE